ASSAMVTGIESGFRPVDGNTGVALPGPIRIDFMAAGEKVAAPGRERPGIGEAVGNACSPVAATGSVSRFPAASVNPGVAMRTDFMVASEKNPPAGLKSFGFNDVLPNTASSAMVTGIESGFRAIDGNTGVALPGPIPMDSMAAGNDAERSVE